METIKTKKGHLIIKMTPLEVIFICRFGINFNLICDNCNDLCNNNQFVYYIPVLNQLFCEECFKKFSENAEYYKEDKEYEERNYNYYISKFKNQEKIKTADQIKEYIENQE